MSPHIGRLLALTMMVAALAPAGAAAQASQPPGPILVMPFENLSGDGRLFWLQEGSAVLLADDLNALGVRAITRTERVRAFEKLHLPTPAALTHATVIKVGQLVGAGEVVLGTLDLSDEELIVRARSIRLDTGRMRAEVVERGPLAELFGIARRVAARVAPAGIERPPGLPAEGSVPSLEAFEHYVKGLLAGTPAAQAAFFETALKLVPRYDRARLGLWEARTDAGEHTQALATVQAVPADSRFTRRARFLGALSRMHLKQHDEAFDTLKALLDEQAAAPLYNNLGIVQLRRGSTPQTGTATYYFNKAAQAEPEDPDYCFNLGYSYWMDRDLQAAIYWLREAVRRDPADGDAHFVLGAALQGVGATVEAAREKELARNLSSAYAEWEQRPSATAEQVPRGLERVKLDLQTPRALRLDAAIVGTAQREQRELALFHLERGRRLFEQELDRDAVVELRRSIFLSPYQAEPHLLLGRIHARGGQLQEAIDAFKIALWSEETVAGRVALGEAYLANGDADAARREADRALTLDPDAAAAKDLLEKASAPDAR
jgi:tetratricopeptide (TPR) repeat protein/TolB-like protein